MKFFISVCLLCFLPELLCLLRASGQSTNTVSSGYSYTFNNIFLEYGKLVLDEVNKYRKLHFFQKKMEWNDTLAKSAFKEAREIVYKKNFGDHEKFEEYDNDPATDYFTEIAVKIHLNDHQMPTKRILAQYILTAVTKDYKFYLVQDYSAAGISVYQNTEPNEFIAVLHLIQTANRYSCKKALDSGKKVNSITINIKGKEETLQCDQTTEGGGWTLITDVNEYGRGIRMIVPIDDRGLDYTQIMFEAKPDFYFNYVSGQQNVWDFDGYNFRQSCIRFGDRWYADIRHQGYNVKYYTYDRTQDITILKQGKKCFYGGSNLAWDCATKFIFKSIPGGERVNAFSEMEAAANVAFTDNIYRFNFKLYVR